MLQGLFGLTEGVDQLLEVLKSAFETRCVEVELHTVGHHRPFGCRLHLRHVDPRVVNMELLEVCRPLLSKELRPQSRGA